MGIWIYPVEPRYVPPGGEFGSWHLDNGAKRSSSHSGVDWAGNRGETIRAAHGGTVVKVGNNPAGWGHYVWIHGDDGKFYGYAHMASAPSVSEGQRVETGDTLGTVGASGAVTGAHLHFVICTGTLQQALNLVRSTLIDPVSYIRERIDPLEPNERQVLPSANVNVRAEPTADSDEVGEIGPGQQFRPLGFVRGELRDNVDVWLAVPAEGARPAGYVWAGGTTDVGTHDLVDLTPPPPAPEPVVEEPPAPVEEPPAPVVPKPTGRRRATAPKIDVPPPPANVLPDKLRTWVYLANWLLGLVLGGTIAGYAAAVANDDAMQFPFWLIIAAAVYANISPHLSLIAQANRTPKSKQQ